VAETRRNLNVVETWTRSMRATRVPARHGVPLVVRESTPRTFLKLASLHWTAFLRRLSVAQSLVAAVGSPRNRRDRRGSAASLDTFLHLYMVRPGVGEALAQSGEDKIQDEPPATPSARNNLQRGCRATRQAADASRDISLVAMPEDNAAAESVDDAAHVPRSRMPLR
jgi:hypothetical protein